MNPLVVGSPIEASVRIMKNTEYTGSDLREPAVGREVARVAALVDHADHEEEAAGVEAVAHHLHDRALDAEQVEADEPQHHVAQVADRRVGDDLLDVGLHEREARAVDDAHHGERHDQRRGERAWRRERAGSRAS